MMQPTNLRNRDDAASTRWLDLSRNRCIPVERQVRSRPVIIRKVTRKNSPQVSFAEHDDVIQAFSPNRSNDPFHVRRLPRRSIRDDDFLDAHVFHALAEVVTVDAVPIPHQETRRFFIRESLDDLLPRPTGGWMLGHVEVNDATAVMPKDHEAIEQAKTHGRDDEEIDGRDVADVVFEERSPRL